MLSVKTISYNHYWSIPVSFFHPQSWIWMGPDWLKFLVMNIFLYFSDSLGKGQATKSDEFSESAKGGGG